MSSSPPDPVKLFIGALYNDSTALAEAREAACARLGPVDYESPVVPFTFTDYYSAEMGGRIDRVFWSFERLIDPSAIVEIKAFTKDVEVRLTRSGKRTVNLDPGYMDYFKVVLASAKFGGNKVYLRDGIYADITLWYEKGRFKPFVWGFPDFKTGAYDAILLKIRERYKAQRNP